ncbi:MAG: conjugal transfer protein TraD [Burkholderiaceae bacterium]
MTKLSALQRRKDAHEKILLGGLVAKAGLRETDPALILGALIGLRNSLSAGNIKVIETLRQAGQRELNRKEPPP